jgi:predicted heme/steroid binding protein
VVFGRVAGAHCAKYMLGAGAKPTSLKELSGGGLTGEVASSKLAGGSYEDKMNIAAPAAGGAGAAPGVAGYTMEEVAKHTSKTDCWVVVDGKVLDVTSFLSEHPGGELAILTFAGKDATEEFNMIHPPDVIGKYAPDAIIGMVGAAAAPAASGGADKPLLEKARTAGSRDWSKADKSRKTRMAAEGKIGGWLGAFCYMVLGFMKEILFTIIPQQNLVITSNRVGLTRSAMFLFIFIIIHAVGNLHVFLGPDDFNGYGYFYVRLYWTGFGFDANIVEEYILLAALLHIIVALKRTWEISINYTVASGKLNLAISGITLLTFMSIHLYQFRFGETQPFKLCPPPYLMNLGTLFQLRLNLFWVDTPGCTTAEVRDIYRMEFEVFQSLGWVLFYLASVVIFTTHTCLGWQKVVPAPALGVPKRYHAKATHVGYAMTAFIALIYASFPIYTHLFPMAAGSISPEIPL